MNAKGFFLKEQFSDVSFIVGPEHSQTWRFPAHRFILTVSSQVFERMFNGNFLEKETGFVRVTDVHPMALKSVLEFIYCNEVQLDDVEITYQVLQTAQKYIITPLVQKCLCFLNLNVNIDSFLPIFHLTYELEDAYKTELQLTCLEFLDKYVKKILQRNEVVFLSQSMIEEILDRDSLRVQEVDIYKGIYNWAKYQCCSLKMEINKTNMRNQLGPALYKLRCFNMSWEEFDNFISDMDILTEEEKTALTKCYMNKQAKLEAPWDTDVFRRQRYMCNTLQYKFWEYATDLTTTKREDTMYIVFSCDIILKKLLFSVNSGENKRVLIRGTITDLNGYVIKKWEYKNQFFDNHTVQKITVDALANLIAFKIYIFNVMCFNSDLYSGNGNQSSVVGRCSEPKQAIFYCSTNETDVEEVWKSFDYWRDYFAHFEWQNINEALNLNCSFEKIQFFIVKRNKESFLKQ